MKSITHKQSKDKHIGRKQKNDYIKYPSFIFQYEFIILRQCLLS